jgi:hypothetical protein
LSTTTASWIPKLKYALAGLVLPFILTGCNNSETIPINSNLKLQTQETTDTGEVVLTLKAFDENNYPQTDLNLENVTVEVDGKPLGSSDRQGRLSISLLEDRNPLPAYIVVLVDFSGSMNRPAQENTSDPSKTKAIAALETLQTLVMELAKRKNTTNMVILPFGEPGEDGSCAIAKDYAVTPNRLQPDQFAPAGSEETELNRLQSLVQNPANVCAATNLYDPISIAIEALGNENEKQFHPDEPEPTPRLGVIVLSDGYDSVNPPEDTDAEKERFTTLEAALQQARQTHDITVHTLGYGLTPEQLGRKYGLGRPAQRLDVTQDRPVPPGRVPDDEFVDEERLVAIAHAGGGYSEFAQDPDQVAKILQSFFDAILGGYEIRYNQPGSDRGSRHTVRVIINSTDESSPYLSYRMPLGLQTPRNQHLSILGGTLLSLILWSTIFYQWSQNLKKQEGEN